MKLNFLLVFSSFIFWNGVLSQSTSGVVMTTDRTQRENNLYGRPLQYGDKRWKRKLRRKRLHEKRRQLDRDYVDNKSGGYDRINIIYIASTVSSIFFLGFSCLVLWYLKDTKKFCFKPKSKKNPIIGNHFHKQSAAQRTHDFGDNSRTSNENRTAKGNNTIRFTGEFEILEENPSSSFSEPTSSGVENDGYGTNTDYTNGVEIHTCEIEIHTPNDGDQVKGDESLNIIKTNRLSPNQKLKITKASSLVNISIATKTHITLTNSCGSYEALNDKRTLSLLSSEQDTKGDKTELKTTDVKLSGKEMEIKNNNNEYVCHVDNLDEDDEKM